MTGRSADERPLNIMGLLGLGFDGRRNEVRITRGENFHVCGGSKETHGIMVEASLRFNDELDRRGKKLGEINARELEEIARDIRREP